MSISQKINFRKIINTLIIIIGVGIIGHLIYLYLSLQGNLVEQLAFVKWYYIIGMGFLALIPTLIHAVRLKIWSGFVDHQLQYKDALAVIISSDLGSAITPTIIGGGPVKLAMLISKGMSGTKATFLTLLSAAEDVIFYGIGIGLSLYYVQENLVNIVDIAKNNYVGFVLLIGIGIILFFFLKLLPRRYKDEGIFGNWLKKLRSVRMKLKDGLGKIGTTFLEILKRGKLIFLLSIILLFLQWIAKFTILAILLRAFNINFTLFNVYIEQWMMTMGLLLVPTPGASGGAEAAFMVVFGGLISGDTMKVIMSIWRFFTYFFLMFISVIIFQFIGRVRQSDE